MQALKLRVPPLALFIIFAIAIWLTNQLLPSAVVVIPFKVSVTLILYLIGILVALMGVLSFKKAKTTVNPMTPENASSLVITGIYKVTRNPMYLGMFCWLSGTWLYTANIAALIWCPLFVWYMNQFQIKPEEEYLTKLFGEEFNSYCQQVRRWL